MSIIYYCNSFQNMFVILTRDFFCHQFGIKLFCQPGRNKTYFNILLYLTDGSGVVVRAEEALIVAFVLLLWVAAIALFFNRWGKIRCVYKLYVVLFWIHFTAHVGTRRLSKQEHYIFPFVSVNLSENSEEFTRHLVCKYCLRSILSLNH